MEIKQCNFPRPRKLFEKESFSKLLWKSFGFFSGKILQNPKMDTN